MDKNADEIKIKLEEFLEENGLTGVALLTHEGQEILWFNGHIYNAAILSSKLNDAIRQILIDSIENGH